MATGQTGIRKHRLLKAVLGIIAAILVVVIAYVAYVFLTYARLEDHMVLQPEGDAAASVAPLAGDKTLVSFNIGMGIYSQDFGFFMDGGEQSRAWSKDEVEKNTQGIFETVAAEDPDFVNLQEVALDCTCNYGVDQYRAAREAFPRFSAVAAQNWNTAYLFYPVAKPFGKAKCCLTTLSRYQITESLRRSVPIDTSVKKIIDLDRCYAVNRIPLDSGADLVLINLHLSAYADDPTIVNSQIEMLVADMQAEYEKGNYVVATGDFNKDLLGDSGDRFGVEDPGFSWTRPFPVELLTDNLSLVAPYDADNPVASVRNADGPYDKAAQYQGVVDGAIVSDNVTVKSAQAIDVAFRNSDHNPVKLVFSLN